MKQDYQKYIGTFVAGVWVPATITKPITETKCECGVDLPEDYCSEEKTDSEAK